MFRNHSSFHSCPPKSQTENKFPPGKPSSPESFHRGTRSNSFNRIFFPPASSQLNKKYLRKMDIANIRVLIVALLVIGLASAQVNFSTSWGKRSSSVLPAPAFSAQESYLALRQKFNSKKESRTESYPQHNALPESDSGASAVYDDIEDQRTIILLPSPCVSLLKVLTLVNQIVEAELQKMEKYDRQLQ